MCGQPSSELDSSHRPHTVLLLLLLLSLHLDVIGLAGAALLLWSQRVFVIQL